jgi:hypothetical protein
LENEGLRSSKTRMSSLCLCLESQNMRKPVKKKRTAQEAEACPQRLWVRLPKSVVEARVGLIPSWETDWHGDATLPVIQSPASGRRSRICTSRRSGQIRIPAD